jgi:hypothetical protein
MVLALTERAACGASSVAGHHSARPERCCLAKWSDQGMHSVAVCGAARPIWSLACVVQQLQADLRLNRPSTDEQGPSWGALNETLARAAGFDVAAARVDVERYTMSQTHRYSSPDQYLALCYSNRGLNTCTFCCHKDRRFDQTRGAGRTSRLCVTTWDSILLRRVFRRRQRAGGAQRQLITLMDAI